MARSNRKARETQETSLRHAVSGSWKAVSQAGRRRGQRLCIAGPGRTRTLAERDLARKERILRSTESGETVPDGAPATDLERAQELVYDAWELPVERRSEQALRALVLSPRCADAYLLLADGAQTLRERTQLCRQAIVAGKAAMRDSLDPDRDLWESLRARPYLRSRAAYARALWDEGELAAAVAEIRELVQLNPGDNLGLRYLMVPLLIELGHIEEAATLVRTWEREPSCEWDFNRALLCLARVRPDQAEGHLEKGQMRNPLVADYLLGLLPLPRRLPDAISFGSEEEAVDYAARALGAWTRIEGALDWLAEQVRLPAPSLEGLFLPPPGA